MSFDDLEPQTPRDAGNSRDPGPALEYGDRALAMSRDAARRCRTVMDIPFGPDTYQKLDLYLPADPALKNVPVILYFHGGAWMHGYKEWNGFIAPCLIDLPAIFISASYRLAPKARYPAFLEDAFAALQWVSRNIAGHGGDPQRIFAAGWSVGGTLASLITLRRDWYRRYGIEDGVIKACFAASAGYRYRHNVMVPGNRGLTYGDLIYTRPQDEVHLEPLRYVQGCTTPFYITHGEHDFGHVAESSKDMANVLKEIGCPVDYAVDMGKDHYQHNLAHAEPTDPWIETVRAWVRETPVSASARRRA